MGEMASLWDYQENNEMEQLGQKLLSTTMELNKLRAEMKNESRKNNEYVNEVIKLLKIAIQQRDDARNQLQNILNNNNTTSQLIVPNSSITESNSLSEPYTYQTQDLVVNQPLVDQGSLIIDTLAKERVLPQKGKLLQSVIEAGPLLHTLLLAGSLPTWRNPPQLQTFQIPPVTINGCSDSEQKPAFNVASPLVNSQRYAQMSCGTARVEPMSNYANGNSMMSSGIDNDNGFYRFAKRQRFC